MVSESLLRVFKNIKAMETTWPGLVCLMGEQKVTVVFVFDSVRFDVEQRPSPDYGEKLLITEVSLGSSKESCVCSAWEAAATIAQRMLSFKGSVSR